MPLKLKRHPKRSNHWYIRGTVRGQAVFETTGTQDRAAAEAMRIKREAELLNRSVFGKAATLTFLEAAVAYVADGGEDRFLGELDEETGKWSLLIGRFAKTPIAAIGQDEIAEAARELYPKAAAATRKRQVFVPMSAVLKHAGRDFRVKHPKVRRREMKFSSPEQLNKLLGACSPKLRRLVVFLTYTGARISECLRLDWERDISLVRRTAYLRRTKNDEPRVVHLADPVFIELANVPEAERHGQVFKWQSRRSVYGPLRRACNKAGVEYLPTHQQGRHTFASWLRIYAGRDLKGLMEDGGWKDVHSVMPYAHLIPGETAAAVDKLPAVGMPSKPKRRAGR